jgi:hypothetical protein
MDIHNISDIYNLPFITNYLDLPHRAGIYFISDGNKILYIGKATNLQKRCSTYRDYFIINNNIVLYYLVCEQSRITAYENKLIKKFNPSLNIAMNKDTMVPLHPTLHFRINRNLYASIQKYCEDNDVTVSDKSRDLWITCLENDGAKNTGIFSLRPRARNKKDNKALN